MTQSPSASPSKVMTFLTGGQLVAALAQLGELRIVLGQRR